MEKIAEIALRALVASEKTTWLFVVMRGGGGAVGLGEATLNGEEAAVREAFVRLRGGLIGARADEDELLRLLSFETLPEAAFSSAVQQAAADLAARIDGVSLADSLGGAVREAVPLYANVNRRTLDRSARGFAASAADARDAGFTAFKIAPFDDIAPGMPTDERRPLQAAGVDRVAAVRDAIGPDARLMVDCHWRFDEAAAPDALQDLRPCGLHWFECPLPNEADATAALRRIRSRANDLGVLLAGAEKGVLLAGFQPFLEAEAYDAMMPDVKYAGGPQEMLRIAEAFAEAGVAFSPHNPSGPVCHAATVQICATLPGADLLECQFDETPLFDAVQAPEAIETENGRALTPTALNGIGIDLRADMLSDV